MTLEELQTQVLEMQEQLNTFKQENETLRNTLTEKEQREKELLEHNQKLFLRVTSKVDETEEKEEEEIPSCIDKDTYKLLDKFDKEILNELIEGEIE